MYALTNQPEQLVINRREYIITTVMNLLQAGVINDSQIDSTINTMVMKSDLELTIALLESSELRNKIPTQPQDARPIDNFLIVTNYPNTNDSPSN